MSILTAKVPRKLEPLLYPKRYKGAYGGRGGAKSHFFAEELILKCYEAPTRAVCIREVQNSIKDSVKQLLADKIAAFGLGSFFDIVEQEIRGANGSLIIFRGMQSYNAANIKSLEAYDIAWVEEAQTLSQHSLDLLRPTIRKRGSELWFSWNPRYKTDPVDAFFRKNPRDNAVCVMVNWRDNPWFPEELRTDMEADFLADPDKAEHVWNGAYGSSQGAILAKWVNKAEREGRIASAAFDPNGPALEISSDLGFRDTASWWFWQRRQNGFALIDYDQDSGLDAEDWAPRLQTKIGTKPLGKIWLPHDARAKTFQSKYSSIERFIAAFGASKVAIVPQSRKADQISAAREVIDRCEFHKVNCEAGLDGLSAWEFEYNDELGVFSREPLHNWASHPSDAFAYGCQVMQEAPAPEKVETVEEWKARQVRKPTLNELWETNEQRHRRI